MGDGGIERNMVAAASLHGAAASRGGPVTTWCQEDPGMGLARCHRWLARRAVIHRTARCVAQVLPLRCRTGRRARS